MIGGFLLMDEPLEGSVVITILVASRWSSAASCASSSPCSIAHMPGWWLLLASGVISLLVGLMLYMTLPWSGLWVVGTLIAVELIVHGVSWVQFGLTLRRSA